MCINEYLQQKKEILNTSIILNKTSLRNTYSFGAGEDNDVHAAYNHGRD